MTDNSDRVHLNAGKFKLWCSKMRVFGRAVRAPLKLNEIAVRIACTLKHDKIRLMYVRLYVFNKELVRTAMVYIDYNRLNRNNACTLQEVATCLIAVVSI